MTLLRTLTIVFLFLNFSAARAQEPVQSVRGTITDKVTGAPLPGATVVWLGSDPLRGVSTDADGNFKFEKIPVGKQSFKVSFLGYKDQFVNSLNVNSGKEVVLNISLEEAIIQGNVVEIVAETDRTKALNEMSTVSARTFSVEETQKYAAAVNDPARMATSFSGVISTDDGNNQISIRGNSPNGLLWRMEGVEVPNPNHFSSVGAAGGGISILSSQLMANSDFMTGAFAAEYGNALSGVFDIKLRQGNNQTREYTVQAGLLGVDVAAEGPFSENYEGSYLVNYRYSTLTLLKNIGVPLGDWVTNFQDLSYNIHLPAGKAGKFSLFGFGGLSNQFSKAKTDSALWAGTEDKVNSNFYSNTAASGLTHFILAGNRTSIKSVVAYSLTGNGYKEEILNREYVPVPEYKEAFDQNRFTVSSTLNHKLNARNSFRTGVIFNNLHFDLDQQFHDRSVGSMRTLVEGNGDMNTVQAFSQWQVKPATWLTLNAGIHYLHLLLNNTNSIEPRLSARVELNDKQAFALAYGLHSQAQPVGVYFAKGSNGTSMPNEDLALSKSNHLVASYDRKLNRNHHVKTEIYYQYLTDVPVSPNPASTLSILNNEYGYVTEALVSEGEGRNYGIELTLERYLSNNLYYLLSGSLYESEYRAMDNQWRNTRFNGNYAGTFTAGKELEGGKKKKRIYGMNVKVIYAGGLRTTPIDLTSSVSEGAPVYFEKNAFEQKNPDYFRADVRFSMKRNREKMTTTLALDIQNVTSRSNVGGTYFDADKGEIANWYQAPLIPVLSYRVEF